MTRKRRNKRQRNKSSPQSLSSPKKYRQSASAADSKTNITDTTDTTVDSVYTEPKELSLSELPDLPKTESESASECGDLIPGANMDSQDPRSIVGESSQRFGFQPGDDPSSQSQGAPGLNPGQPGIGFFTPQSL